MRRLQGRSVRLLAVLVSAVLLLGGLTPAQATTSTPSPSDSAAPASPAETPVAESTPAPESTSSTPAPDQTSAPENEPASTSAPLVTATPNSNSPTQESIGALTLPDSGQVSTQNLPACTTSTFSYGSYTVVRFVGGGTSCNWTPPAGVQKIDTLVIGGGGGGGSRHGGGGGAGGVVYAENLAIDSTQTATILVGSGGAGATASGTANVGVNGSSGSATQIVVGSNGLTANGGGFGTGTLNGADGGSGGGARSADGAPGSSNQTSVTQKTFSGAALTSGSNNVDGLTTTLTSYGNSGGRGVSSGCNADWCGGGGGGAGGAGSAATSSAGNGGAGIANSITGSSVVYAGGGGGAGRVGATGGVGGTGGGGAGGMGAAGAAATPNTGSGGGGGGHNGNSQFNGGAGASGQVIIRYESTPTDVLPVSSGLFARYRAADYDTATRFWPDSSGNARDVLSNGIISNPTKVTTTANTNGSSTSFTTLQGTTAQGVVFPTSVLPSTYTLFHVARYNAGARTRIFDGATNNWLSGFWNGLSGVAHHTAWNTQFAADVHVNNWIVSTDTNSTYQSNGISRTTGSTSATTNLTINQGNSREYSDWQVAEVIVYNRTLTNAEVTSIEQALKAKYGIAFEPNIVLQASSDRGESNTDLNTTGRLIFDVNFTSQINTSTLAASDFTNTGTATCSIGNLQIISTLRATVTATCTTDGTVRVAMAAGAVTDVTGSTSLVATSQEVTFTVTPPTCTSAELGISVSPFACYRVEDYDATNKYWSDSSGNNRDVTSSLFTTSAPNVVTTTANTNGSSRSFRTLQGTTVQGLKFPTGVLPANYTVFHMARYNGASQGRIFAGNTSANWLSGFWSGMSGIAHHGGWLTQASTSVHQNNWVLSSDQKGLYRSNGVTRSTSVGGNNSDALTLNFSAYSGDNSDWQASEVIVFNQELTLDQIRTVEQFLKSKYGLSFEPVITLQRGSDRGASDTDLDTTGRLNFDIVFPSAITSATFTASDLRNAGTATCTFGNLQQVTTVRSTFTATCTTNGTVEVTMNAGAVTDVTNAASAIPTNQTITFTATPPSCADLPVQSSLFACYRADDYDPVVKYWADSSGNNRDVTSDLFTASAPTLVNVTGAANGVTGTFKTLQGTTAQGVTFPTSVLPSTYTLFHVARYSGATKGRIISGANGNWLSGFFSNASGVAHHGAWNTLHVDSHGSNWVVSTDKKGSYRSNGTNRTTSVGGLTSDRLTINRDPYGQASDWQASEVIVFDRELNASEVYAMEQFLKSKYGVTSFGGAQITPTIALQSGSDRGVSNSDLITTGRLNFNISFNAAITNTTLLASDFTNSGTASCTFGNLVKPSTSTITTASVTATCSTSGTVIVNLAANAVANYNEDPVFAAVSPTVTFTAESPSCLDLPVTTNLFACYRADDYDPMAKYWADSSGNNRDVTSDLFTADAPTLITTTANTNESTASFRTVQGTTAHGVTFPASVLPSNYTLFHVARYAGATQRRIFDGLNGNWLSGFWNGSSGVAFRNNTWITRSSPTYHGSNWVLSTDRKGSYRSNGVLRGTGGSISDRLTINMGGASNLEKSDWQASEIIVFDRELTAAEIFQVERFLKDKYGLTAVASSQIAAGTILLQSASDRGASNTDLITSGTMTFNVTFPSPITDGTFIASDLVNAATTGAATCTFATPVKVTTTNYTFNATCSSNGNLRVQIPQDAVTDADGKSSLETLSSQTVVVDNAAPTVAAISSASSNGTFSVGTTVNIAVRFSENVAVTGVPTLALNVTNAGTSKVATYSSGSGTNTLNFAYTIVAGDTTSGSSIDYTSTSALGTVGTITDTAGNIATRTLPPLPAASGVVGRGTYNWGGGDKWATYYCPTGTAVIGVTMRDANGVGIRCATVNGDGSVSPVAAETQTGFWSIPTVGWQYCPTYTANGVELRSIATGFQASASRGMGLICSTPPSLTTTPLRTGMSNGVNSADLPCSTGEAIVGMNVRYNLWLDAVQVICGVVAPTNSLSRTSTIRIDAVPPAAPGAPTLAALGGTVVAGYVNSTNTNWTATSTFTADDAVTAQLFIGSTMIEEISLAPRATSATFDLVNDGAIASATTANLQAFLTAGGSVTVRLVDAAGNVSLASTGTNLTVDYVAPTVSLSASSSSLLSGQTSTVTATVSEPLATGSFTSSDFGLTPSTGSGSMATLSSASGTAPNITFTSVYTPPATTNSASVSIGLNAGVFTDVAGNPSAAAPTPVAISYDTAAPTATGLCVAGTTCTADGAYKAGSTIDVTVSFSEVVLVTTTGGTPTLLLETGATDRTASYVSGSGTNTLTFRYTVQAGDTSADLTQQSTSALILNGGTIKDAAGNNSPLTLPGITSGTTGALATNKAIVVDTTAPATPTSLTVTPVGGTVVANTLNSTNTNMTASATITAGSATGGIASLFLGSTLLTTDASILAGDTSVTFNLGRTTAAELQAAIAAGGNLTVVLTDPAGNISNSSTALVLTVDYVAPTVSLSASSSSLLSGQTSTVTATVSEPLATGSFTSSDFGLTPSTGSGSMATLSSASGTAPNITFTSVYTPPATTNSASVSIGLNAGVFTDVAGNPSAAAPTPVAISYDTAAPTATGLCVAGTTCTADGAYKAGSTIDVTVSFSEVVLVTTTGGTPTLLLETGATDRTASYVSGSGTNTLTFRYTVQAGDTSADLTQQSTSALILNGGTIKDAAGNNSPLTLPGITSGTTGALATNKAIVVDTTAPATPTSLTVTPVGGTVVANTLNSTNTNMTASATITAGSATGGRAELLLGTTVIAVDNSIISSDTSLSFSLGTATTSALQAALPAGGQLTVALYDAAGNLASSTALTLTVDYSVPTVTITSDKSALIKGQTSIVNFTLSESSTNFVAADVTVTGGTLSNFSGSGTNYSATFTPTANSTTQGSVSVSANKFTDALQNSNSQSNNGSALTFAVDTIEPTISSVAIASNNSNTAVAVAGNIISVTVGTSENITVVGTPTLPLTLGSTNVSAVYVSGSGTRSLVFQYVVQGGDLDSSGGIAVGTPSIGGATLQDTAGNNLVLTMPSTTNSLVVDAVPPTVSLDVVALNDEVNAAEKAAGVTLSGTSEAGSSVTLEFAGLTILSPDISVNQNGNWSYTLTSSDWTAIGSTSPVTVTAISRDAAGNAANRTRSVRANLVAVAVPGTPDLRATDDTGISDSDNLTTSATLGINIPLVVSGSTVHSAGQTLSLIDGSGIAIVSTVLTSADIANGSFLFTYTVPSDGTYVFTSKVTSASNSEVSASSLNVTVDNRLPGAPGAPDLLAISDSGVSSSDNITSTLTPTFRIDISGVAFGTDPLQANDLIRLFLDGGETAIMTAQVTSQDLTRGYIEFAPTLTSGNRTITATAATPAGATSNSSRPLVIQIDTTGQSPTGTPDLLTSDDTGSNTSDNVTSVSAPGFSVPLGSSGAVAGDTIELIKGGSVIGSYVLQASDVSSGTANVFVTSALADGSHSISTRIKDRAFNLGSLSNSIVVTINSAIPATPTIAISNESDSGTSNTDRLSNSVSPTLTGTATSGTTVKVYIGGVYAGSVLPVNGNWSWTVSPPLVNDGSYSFTALIEDSAGNESGFTAPVSLTLDKTSPSAPVVNAQSANVSTPVVTGTAEANSVIKLYKGTTLLGTVSTGSNGTWSVASSALTEGANTLTATATDAAGNVSTSSNGSQVNIDSIAPNAPVVNDLSPYSLSPTISGTGEVGASVTLFDGATQVGTATVASDGTWTILISPALSNSAHSFSAKQTDAAGNTSSASSPAQEMSLVMAAALTAADSNASNDNISLTAAQYAASGITGIDSAAKASTLNDAIDGLAGSNINTNAKIQELANVASKIFQLATTGSTSPEITISELQLLGLQNVSDPGALNAIIAAIAATPDDASSVSSLAGIQAVIDNALIAFQDALAKLIAFDEASSTGSAIPSKSTYEDAGISRVDTSDVGILNTYMSSVDDALINTSGEVQAVVDVYRSIMAGADGTASNNVALTLTDIQKLDLAASGQSNTPNANIDSASELSLFNSILDSSTTSDVNSYSKLVNLASIAERIMAQAAGQTVTPALTISDFIKIGITGVTSANLAEVLAAIAATNNDGSAVDTLSELRAVVSNAIATISANALDKIAQYDGTLISPSLGAPTLNDYANAEVLGVNNSNISSMNTAVAALTYGATDSLVEVQAIVDGYQKALDGSDGLKNSNSLLSQQNLTGLGLSMINNATEVQLLNSVIDTRVLTATDTYPELSNLASITDRIIRSAAGENVSPALAAADYSALGIPGVTDANSSYVLSAIAGTNNDGSEVDTHDELSDLVSDAVLAATTSALLIISTYDGTVSTTTPTTSNYANANVSGVSSSNVAAVSAILSAIASTSRDTTSEVQAIVDAYLLVLNAANGVDNSISDFSLATFANLGMSSINTSAKQTLATDVIDRAYSQMVDSVADLDAIELGVNTVVLTALGQNPSPALSTEMLSSLGVTGASSENLNLITAAISATADDGSGVATRSQVQAIVDSVIAAQASALAIISSYTGSGTTVPVLQTYIDAGVTFGVTPSATTVSALNTFIANLGIAQTDSRNEVQAISDTVAAILAAADGQANSNSSISQSDLSLIGITAINSSVEANLLNSIIDSASQSAVDTFAEVNALAEIVDRLMRVAAGQEYSPALTPSDFALLGLSNVTSSNISEVLTAIGGTANNGSDISTIQLLSALVNQTVSDVTSAALDKISNFAGSPSADAPTVRDFANANVIGVSSGNVDAISAYLATLPRADRDSTAEIQVVVDAYLALLSAANGVDNNISAISQSTFSALGMGAINETVERALATDVIDNLSTSGIDTPTELNKIAAAVNAVIQTAAGFTPSPAIDVDLMSVIGVQGVTADNLALVKEAIALTADNGSEVSTKAQIQAVVDSVIASQASALSVIAGYVGSPGTVPTLTTYAEAGVVFASPPSVELLAYINSFMEILPSSETNSLGEIQRLIDLITELFIGADGIANQNVSLTWQEFQVLGFVDVKTASEAAAKNEAIDILDMAAITTTETPVIEVVAPKDQALVLDITPPVFANLQGVDHYAYRYSSDGGQTWTDYDMAAKLKPTQAGSSQSFVVRAFKGFVSGLGIYSNAIESQSQGKTSALTAATDSIEVKNLENRVTYQVKVRAVTVAGPSQVSVPKAGMPDAPLQAPVNPVTPNPTTDQGTSAGSTPSASPKASSQPKPTKKLFQLPVGSSTAVIDGKPVKLKIEQIDDSTIVGSIPGVLSVSMKATDSESSPLPISKNGSLLVNRSGLVAVEGQGLKSGSEVEVWLRSTPVLLGRLTTSEGGAFTGSLRLPDNISAGQHTINLVGVLPSGESVTLALGIEVVDDTPVVEPTTEASPNEAPKSDKDSEAKNSSSWLGKLITVGAIALLIGGFTWFFWFILWRRRDDEEEPVIESESV